VQEDTVRRDSTLSGINSLIRQPTNKLTKYRNTIHEIQIQISLLIFLLYTNY